MRIAYKPLVERYNIPRPTLIEWQKKAEDKTPNWRTKHLQYLREQLEIEEETIGEINQKGILLEEYFLWVTFLFFEHAKHPLPKSTFAQKLRKFSFVNEFGVEYQHPYAKRIWLEVDMDGRMQRVAPYVSLVEVSERLTAAQYYCVQTILLRILDAIRQKLNTNVKPKLIGSTWQELHMYDKAFSVETLKKALAQENLSF
ncbi:hypothetical protein JWV37_05205 [Sulfurospirillum sp. T05]|uniref:Uncharacterized protein n=1 Tax=Sulfurospirillum tamanense TaxID=2813362 RepID=A0ABS2WRD6_9BACT|nr:hypothetical protein [Sulfurospirillum tamanensis]MBN2964168.1 hypothetical protein [Sulfurospirillum tamanensis]